VAVTPLLLAATLLSAAPSSAESGNLVGNPGFEVDTSGWRTGSSSSSLTRVAGGRTGSFAAQLSNASSGSQCALEDDPGWIAVTQPGPYTVGIWVRSDASGRTFKLRIREYSGGSQVGSTSSTVTMTSTWQLVSVGYTPAAPGQSRLDFQGYTSSTPVGVCFQADDAFASVSGTSNNPPVAVGDSATTPSGTPVTLNVLANDSDPDNDPLTVSGATAPAHGAAAVNADNTITYTPAAGYTGPDSFTYTIGDGRGGTASGAVSITVTSPGEFGPPYDIAVFGDVPYSSSAVSKYQSMIASINAGSPLFSVHVGDIGPGSSSTCTAATVDRETARFDTFTRPLVYTPGDNEWTDCDSAALTQLSYIRTTVFRGTGTQSRGQTRLTLESQGAAGYPENARWRQGPVTFATIHMTGSKDNYSNRSEHDARRSAGIAWLRETFAQAKARGDRGIVLVAHSDPKFSKPTSSAYGSMYTALRSEVLAFPGQVLFVHGDGHDYINDQPMAGVSNLRRVEVEGDGDVSYVKVRVDPNSSGLFIVPQPTRF
jgi:hypothetical protein